MRRLLVLMMLGVAACGGDDAPTNDATDNDPPGDQDVDPGSITVAIDPAAITISEGSSGSVAITVTRTGALADAAVTYSLNDVPSGVATEFAGDVLTLRVPFFTQNKTGMVTLIATANGRTAFAKLTLTVAPPTPITIDGTLVSFEDERPLLPAVSNQIAVAVWGRGSTTPVTVYPTDGIFHVANVTPPYDVLLTVGIEPPARHLYIGLGRGNPTLTFFGYSTGQATSAAHSFRYGATDPNAVGYNRTAAALTCGSGAFALELVDGTGTIESTPRGPSGTGATTCSASELAVQLDGSLMPVNYATLASESASVDLSTSGTTDFVFAASAASTTSVAVAYTPAPSLLPAIEFVWLPDAQRTLRYAGTSELTSITQLAAPADPTVTAGACMSAVAQSNPSFNPLTGGGTTACRLISGVASVAFGTLAGPTSPGAPNGTIGATAVAFAAPAPGFAGYIIDKVTAPTGETMVFTGGTLSAQVMTRHGIPFETGADYSWQGFVLTGVTSVDAFVSRDVTRHGFITRQAGYTISASQPFHIQ